MVGVVVLQGGPILFFSPYLHMLCIPTRYFKMDHQPLDMRNSPQSVTKTTSAANKEYPSNLGYPCWNKGLAVPRAGSHLSPCGVEHTKVFINFGSMWAWSAPFAVPPLCRRFMLLGQCCLQQRSKWTCKLKSEPLVQGLGCDGQPPTRC